MSNELFPEDKIVGVFRGFQEGGLEFHADLTLPYKNEFQNIPMHGQFLLVQLESPREAILGRISSLSADGKLSSGVGEEYNIRAMRDKRAIPEDLRESYLKYRVNIRVLGVIRVTDSDSITFVPSHRRLPHVGSWVAFPSDNVLKEIAGHNIEGAEIGHFALGEYVFSGGSDRVEAEDWMKITYPEITVKYPIDRLVSRRSFIFARAGYGKSNLNKLLFSELYKDTPHIEKRHGRLIPVGTVIFDPDGEYFWPDDRGRPGLCDVPHLKDKLVVFTSRKAPSEFYQSFVASGVKLDIRTLRPTDVISIALSPEKQDQQNVHKLKSLNQEKWERLVDLIDSEKYGADLNEIWELLSSNSDAQQQQLQAEATAARSNMATIVQLLHDKSSRFLDALIVSLREGKLCIVDLSQMRGNQGLILSGLILRRIFDRNQDEFTKADPRSIPTIAVVEEAQAVLKEKQSSSEPYIEWVKEGRKYDLGALLITQQPGSIPVEILSQGDNWFLFHLLSASDLGSVKKANAHFSDDILSSLLNEPIKGQGVFWSSEGGKSYPISLRVLSFDKLYKPLDADYSGQRIEIFAGKVREEMLNYSETTTEIPDSATEIPDSAESESSEQENGEDYLQLIKEKAIHALESDKRFFEQLDSSGVRWYYVLKTIENILPPSIEDKNKFAYNQVPFCLNRILGTNGWDTFKDENGKTRIRRKSS